MVNLRQIIFEEVSKVFENKSNKNNPYIIKRAFASPMMFSMDAAVSEQENMAKTTKEKPFQYSAVFIEDPKYIAVLDKIVDIVLPEDFVKVEGYHQTISLGKFPESLRLRGDLNKEVDLKIIGIGMSSKAIALKVEGFLSKNEISH